MMPPRTPLSWDQVVDYAFLADFDLMREGREDIRSEPWALPSGRVAMDQHYKLLRANEEIARLDLEIPRLVTYICDEEAFLWHHEQRLCEAQALGLAHQVRLRRMERGRFTALHMDRLVKLSKEKGFTASILPGVSVSKERRVPRTDRDVEMRAPSPAPTTADADVGMLDTQRATEEPLVLGRTMPRVRAPIVFPPPRVIAMPPLDPDDPGQDQVEPDIEAIANAFEHIMRMSHDPVVVPS